MATVFSDARRLTREEYDRLVRQGFFPPDARLELIDGNLVEMAPQTSFHSVGVNLIQVALSPLFAEGCAVRVQLPLGLGKDSEPEPDIAVVPGHPRDYSYAHPTSALLVVEVADSSLVGDRRRKASLYAQAGVPEYWILNLPKRCLEIYRDPQDGAYASPIFLQEGSFVSPLTRPAAQIAVSDLLPLPPK